ncbi:NACHT, LRR and PYD domains-containing protein 12-like isoform X2 [Alosa pseudoharengus]|uniref:NACHT, LRR and PYD domains-containing protein 12-like isoform X2 n=1 Tax=Alosa pseudoharengus TaxID=34774 RepID=UPI003F8BFFF0
MLNLDPTMTAALKEVLRKTLDNLSGADFKEFKHCLQDEGQMPQGKLGKADTDDTVDLMVQVHSMGAGGVMVTILQKMKHNQLAMDLERDLGRLGDQPCSPGLTGEGGEINVNVAPVSGGIVNAPAVTGCTINGPLTFTFGQMTMPQQRAEHPGLQNVLTSHKVKMEKRVKNICEGMEKTKREKQLKQIFTKLYIVEGKTEGVNNEHEVWQIETASRPQTTEERSINCNDIFKPSPGEDRDIRTVLTMGVAGIGKTVSVQKFILDWAEGKANQDVAIMLMLTFRELNLLKAEYSLHDLFCDLYPELKKLGDTSVYDEYKTLIIFDGLDESRTPLDFNKEIVASVNKASSIDVLITSIIRGKLLPSALVWITSRPAAVNQIPSEHIDQITEVRGFTDRQKEEYFRKRTDNKVHANKIVSHIKTSRTLHIMCHIPVFCWILATVLQKMLTDNRNEEMPKTVTEMYIHFLLIQTNIKNQKYCGRYETNKQRLLDSHSIAILNLAKLAFTHLDNGRLLFSDEDLRECNIDVSEDSVYSGMCAEILKEDSVFFEEKVYCFVHLSIQEFLAALFVFHSHVSGDQEVTRKFLTQTQDYVGNSLPLYPLLRCAMKKALDSKNGHLDLFLRFLVGISLERNQSLLQGLLPNMVNSSGAIKRICKHIKEKTRNDESPERCLNLLHCLFEMNDHSVHDEVQEYLKSSKDFSDGLSALHCSALAHMLLISEEVVDELDLKKYNTCKEGRKRLVPVVRHCRKAVLAGCYLTEKSYEIVAYALHCANSPLRELDLSHNDLEISGEKLLSALQNPNCKLETLRLNQCHLSKESCAIMASVLQRTPSHLRELDMSDNDLQDEGVELLCVGLRDPQCKLETLRVKRCHLSQFSCKMMTTVLQWTPSHLRELDMSDNDLQDEGVELLCVGLRDPQCKLETLSLSGCLITHKGCSVLASALKSNHSHLKQLDLSYNYPGPSGVRELTDRLDDPNCKLQTFRYEHGAECRLKPSLRKYACELTLDPNTANPGVALSNNNTKVTALWGEQPYPEHSERFTFYRQVLCRECLSGRCYWEVEWSGKEVEIAVAYKSIPRKGGDSGFGWNKAWSLSCSDNSYSVCQNMCRTVIPPPSSGSSRVGVYLDWPAGTLSFYSVSSNTLTHLHTFHSTFTEPLYPGFKAEYANNNESSVSLCQIACPPTPEIAEESTPPGDGVMENTDSSSRF